MIVEGLTNPESISTNRVVFIGLPLKVEDGNGTPIWAAAIAPGGTENDWVQNTDEIPL